MRINPASTPSQTEFLLKNLKGYYYFPGNETISVNICTLRKGYYVQVGERDGKAFRIVLQSPYASLKLSRNLTAIIRDELRPFDQAASLFDIYIDGKLIKEAEKD